jgi:thiol-disulfide isomerase/thioredoxin
VTQARLFAAIGAAAILAGATLWHLTRPVRSPASPPSIASPAIAPAAIHAATFADAGTGAARALGQFQGHVTVVNFWATWCGPCRAEMPAFERLHQRWSGRGVRFVGLSDEAGDLASRFGRELGVTYPLWTGTDQVSELSRRLGNRLGVLPHTVILDPRGSVLDQRVGPYTEAELDARLDSFVANSSERR